MATAERDVEAIARASHYVKHGTTHLGGTFKTCICPRQPCGGVSGDDERDDCPDHRRTPNQLWHWATECPGS
ncbi:hypothetical protein ACFQ0X_44135 [Streptomyces rectiviolaceus]|uniref:hypothetical protein n=1 Tax=Streptomyces rectiviolaceus TaxID=332591 RepID=UPI003640BB51